MVMFFDCGSDKRDDKFFFGESGRNEVACLGLSLLGYGDCRTVLDGIVWGSRNSGTGEKGGDGGKTGDNPLVNGSKW